MKRCEPFIRRCRECNRKPALFRAHNAVMMIIYQARCLTCGKGTGVCFNQAEARKAWNEMNKKVEAER